jgi:DNA-directed RNA polymerase specialized sigma24 family protein
VSSVWVDDIAQGTFVVAARRLAEFEGRSSIKTWLFAITLRVVQSHRRWSRRQKRKEDAYAEAEPRASVGIASRHSLRSRIIPKPDVAMSASADRSACRMS